jgi:hypothetical protein
MTILGLYQDTQTVNDLPSEPVRFNSGETPYPMNWNTVAQVYGLFAPNSFNLNNDFKAANPNVD